MITGPSVSEADSRPVTRDPWISVMSVSTATNSRIVSSIIGREAKYIRMAVRDRGAHPLMRQFAACIPGSISQPPFANKRSVKPGKRLSIASRPAASKKWLCHACGVPRRPAGSMGSTSASRIVTLPNRPWSARAAHKPPTLAPITTA